MPEAATTAEAPFPRPFGKYTLLEPLAKGGMGSLYLACQGEAGMEKLCVVKTVLKELADKEYVARFRDEAKVVVRLAHGNLVPVFDAGTVAGEMYVAMEYIDGKDLRAVWNRCAKKQVAFPIDVAVYIIKELLRGLSHAHNFGELALVHRDVSPPNVLLAFSGEVKLTDFGLASSTLKLEKTAPGIIYGKVSYMSPEQARGEPLDGRTDLYAAAIILWELLTGRQLFASADGDVLERVRDPKLDPPSARAQRVSKTLDAIVMRALARDRKERYSDCEAFRKTLAEFLAHEAPATDAARVQAFLKELFDDEIEADRIRRDRLVRRSRRGAATLNDASGEIATGNLADVDPEAPRSHGILGTLVDGRYRVSRLVGEGGMGRVYEAEHVDIGKRVAMKVLHPSYTRHAEAVHRFRREARAAAKLGHPNIVDVTDSGTTAEGAVYFVMEFLEGRDLADLLGAEGKLPVDRVIHIGVQLARALAAAHEAGIVHRDLKPENVFLIDSKDGSDGARDFVKVLDFGIARQLELEPGQRERRLTNPGMAMGTPEYMAPEQAAGKPADARCDVYAAGAMLYEMLAGTPPHTGENFMEVLSKKATEVPPPVSTLRPDAPAMLSDLLVATLARDPAQRPQTMQELARALERCRPDRRGRSSTGATPIAESPAAAATAAPSPGSPASPAKPGAAAARGAGEPAFASGLPRPSGPVIAAALTAALLGGSMVALGVRARRESARAAANASANKPATAAATFVMPPSRPARTVQTPAATAASSTAPPEQGRAAPVSDKERAHRHGPGIALLPLAEAQRLLAEHQLTAADQAFRDLHAAGVDRAASATALAQIAWQRGYYVDAIQWGERATREGGGASAHLVLGDSYAKVFRWDAAAHQYQKVLQLKPDDAEARARLALAQRRSAGT